MSDLISRQDAIDAMIMLGIKRAIPILETLPSAETERKKGKWIRKQPIAVGEPRFICSECRGQFRNPYNFCPNCGAEMTR